MEKTGQSEQTQADAASGASYPPVYASAPAASADFSETSGSYDSRAYEAFASSEPSATASEPSSFDKAKSTAKRVVERVRVFFTEDMEDDEDEDDEKKREPRTARSWLFDVAVAIVAFAFGCVQMLLTSTSVIYVDVTYREIAGLMNYVPNAYAYIALAFTTLPLILRREAPWPILGLVIICFLFSSRFMTGVSLSAIGPMVGVYTVASERGRLEALIACVLTAVLVAFVSAPSQSDIFEFAMRVQNVALVVASALAGLAVRTYQAYLRETKRRLEEAERSREELAARRVAEERVSIAREVHDITAHSLSAVTIQAAAAERLVDINPAAAKEAISDIRTVSKSALDEIRSMIGVLRGDEGAERAPAEGTERMPDVVDYLRRAEIEVEFDDDGYARETVPAFVDMALFALAREAATNTVRHAQAQHVRIALWSGANSASLRFSDDGVGIAPEVLAKSDGHGIAGMRERIEALNGRFAMHSSPGKGCIIEVDIPMEVMRHGANE